MPNSTPQALKILAGIVLIATVTFAAYWPAVHGGFIMDDDTLLAESDFIKASDGLSRFWFTSEPDDYWPMTNSSLWLEWRLWGNRPAGYHATNLLLHLAATLLVWRILALLSIPGAFLAAFIFAVHPVNVESIAWIAQRKNALAMVFFLLSILWYLRSNRRVRGFYCLSLLAFTLAMLSKGSVAILPLLLLLLDWWQRRRITWADLARTIPFFVVAGALTAVNLWFQTHGANVVIREASFGQRLAGAGAVIWFYLSKAFLPLELVFVYPPWNIGLRDLLWWLPLLAVALVTVVLARRAFSSGTRWSDGLLVGWLFFCIALLPVLGFNDVGFMKYSLVADHYQHIAIIAVAALVAAGWSWWHSNVRGPARAAAIACVVLFVGVLVALTWRQSRLYGHPVALYEETLQTNPTCWLAHNNLGLELVKANRIDDSIPHYQEAVRLRPDYPEALNNLGTALIKTNRPQEAIEPLEKALRLKPDFPQAHNNLGNALKKLGRLPEAIKHFQQSLRIKPDFSVAEYNWGLALAEQEQFPAAIQHYERALQFQPNFFEAEYNLALALNHEGKLEESIAHFRNSLAQKGDAAEAHSSLGGALNHAGRYPEAIEQLTEALRIDPNFAEAHNNLGIALASSNKVPEAIQQFETALRLKPEYAEAHQNLGVALCRAGQVEKGIEQFEEVLRLNPNSLNAYSNLSKAYTVLDQPAKAIAAAQQALELARKQENSKLIKEIEDWLKTYRAAHPGNESAAPTAGPSTKSRPSQQ